MTIQTTFRSVAKPKMKVYSTALAGGQLPLDGATTLVFAGPAVGAPITSLLGHEYLIDSQDLSISNAHPTNALTITIGSFSRTIPAGYALGVKFDEANASFYSPKKHADLKPIEDSVADNALAIAQEVTDRQNDTATLVKLDGSRAMTGNLDLNSNFLVNVPAGTNSDHVINKAQFDLEIAELEAAISANATALSWRETVNYVTQFTTGTIPVNGEALVDSNFGAGNNRLFEDDEAGTQATVANIAVDATVMFLKAGLEPKLMVVRDVLGTKRWYDHTEVNANLKLERAIQAGDTFIVEIDLLTGDDLRETQAIYHISPGTPKLAVKLGDFDWRSAAGIGINSSYEMGPGGQTITLSDHVGSALGKLEGNIVFNAAQAASNLSAAIAQEVVDRNSAISTAIAQEVLDRNAAITALEDQIEANLASVASGEGASLVGVHDADGLYAATTVEGALREVRQHVNAAEVDIVAIETDVADHTTQLAQHTADIADLYALDTQHKADLASASVGKGASLIAIHDAAGNFTATTVEGALAELDDKVDNLNLVNLKRGLHEVATTGALSLNLSTNFVDQLVGGVVQDLSGATYMNAMVNRDGAMLIGGVGYTISGSTIAFTAAGGGELIAGEVLEIKIIDIS